MDSQRWFVDEKNRHTAGTDRHTVRDENGLTVATVIGDRADAAMVAAAPEMLEALEALDKTMERIDRSHLTFTDRKLIDGMYAQILNAISSAKRARGTK